MISIFFYFANLFEKLSFKLKKHISKKVLNEFLKKYSLIDGKMQAKTDIRFNPYERTNLLLIDELIKSNEINKNDKIMDIGCGAGIFLIYLASKNFKYLYGIEIDQNLKNLCINNISNFKKLNNYQYNITIILKNALEVDINNNINCFYLFNTFYDKDTYLYWLKQVKKSLMQKPRTIKIIILYPTVASMGAMRECSWLKEKTRIFSKFQYCYPCVHFIIYESV